MNRFVFTAFAACAFGLWASSEASAASAFPAVCKEILRGRVWKLTSGDGVIIGWAFDTHAPERTVTVNFYLNAPASKGGILAGSQPARAINKAVNWGHHVEGNHGFSFRIPDAWRDGQPHTIFVQPVAPDGEVCSPIGKAEGYSFTLPVSSKVHQAPVTNTHCLDESSRCPSFGENYLAPNYPTTSGWSDGKNYFEEWGCTSPAGFNAIARLNILPLGTIGPHVQKDSLDFGGFEGSNPIIYFTLKSADHGSWWSLKKAIFSTKDDRWNIYSVLDNPGSPGGLSSQNGRGKFFIMNNHSLPGLGPSSPIPGPENKIPGVSDVSASNEIPSYPLMGSSPLGITAIANTVHPSTSGSGVHRKTCLHMNPKLLDYDAQGVPHTLITNMWQNTRHEACPLPPGAPLARLPAPGNYLYRYEGPDLGWQLDLKTGLITDSLHNETRNTFILTPKLLGGTSHLLVAAIKDGMLITIDLDRPKNDNTDVLLDCRKGGVHFNEAGGGKEGIFFLASKQDIDGERKKYGLGNDVYPADIYYVFRR